MSCSIPLRNKAKEIVDYTITHNSKTKHLGYFENEIDAVKARDMATKKMFGEFGKLNFPDEVED